MIDIGIIIRQLRIEKKITQEQLARLMDVSVSTIGNWESAALFPNTDRLVKLAEVFNVTLNYLTGIDKERTIVLDRLTLNQQNLLKTLVLEFQNKEKTGPGLSDRQKDIVSDLIAEFSR